MTEDNETRCLSCGAIIGLFNDPTETGWCVDCHEPMTVIDRLRTIGLTLRSWAYAESGPPFDIMRVDRAILHALATDIQGVLIELIGEGERLKEERKNTEALRWAAWSYAAEPNATSRTSDLQHAAKQFALKVPREDGRLAPTPLISTSPAPVPAAALPPCRSASSRPILTAYSCSSAAPAVTAIFRRC